MTDPTGTLAPTEYHPAADLALQWIRALPALDLFTWTEAFASTALSGNRLAEVCFETLRRIRAGEVVSDRYVLGLAWSMRFGEKP